MDANKAEAQSWRERHSGLRLHPACVWHPEQYKPESVYKRNSGQTKTGTRSQTQSVLSNIIIVSNQMFVVLLNYWCPREQVSVWHFWRRNRASLVPQHKESACNAGAAVDADPVHVAPRLPCPWAFPGKSTRGACHFLLQEISATRGGNTGLLHCRHILSELSHQENH